MAKPKREKQARTAPKAGKKYLKNLLKLRNQAPDKVSEIDEDLRRTFEQRVAVLVLDMVGFSRLTAKYGIIHYLAMIQQMEEAATPAVERNRGTVIKQEADNLFATFKRPQDALEAALDIFLSFEAINSVVPDERDIYGSIGIGYGDILVIGDEDIFGNELNLASKLGEDIAGKMEILITAAAAAEIPSGFYEFESASFKISGMDLECRRFKKRLAEKPRVATSA